MLSSLRSLRPLLHQSNSRDKRNDDDDAPVHDPVLVKVLEREQDFSGVELCAPRRELLPLDVEHEISSRHVLHDKVDTRLGLKARVEAEEERVPFACGGEEDALLRFRPASPFVSSYRQRPKKERTHDSTSSFSMMNSFLRTLIA